MQKQQKCRKKEKKERKREEEEEEKEEEEEMEMQAQDLKPSTRAEATHADLKPTHPWSHANPGRTAQAALPRPHGLGLAGLGCAARSRWSGSV